MVLLAERKSQINTFESAKRALNQTLTLYDYVLLKAAADVEAVLKHPEAQAEMDLFKKFYSLHLSTMMPGGRPSYTLDQIESVYKTKPEDHKSYLDAMETLNKFKLILCIPYGSNAEIYTTDLGKEVARKLRLNEQGAAASGVEKRE